MRGKKGGKGNEEGEGKLRKGNEEKEKKGKNGGRGGGARKEETRARTTRGRQKRRAIDRSDG